MAAEPIDQQSRDGGTVDVVISITASITTGVAVATGMHGWHRVLDQPVVFVAFLALTLVLQSMAVDVYGRGSTTVSGIGHLAVGFMFGIAPAMLAAAMSALTHALRARSPVHRAVFNTANFALAAAGGTAAYEALGGYASAHLFLMFPALAAGVVLWAINIGMLSVTMGLAYGENVFGVWRERYRWATVHYISFGPLALAAVVGYERLGIAGLTAFVLPPSVLMFSVRQYLNRTRVAVEEVRRANEELRRANEALEARNADLHELFEFAGGLAARANDQAAIVDYAQSTLGRLVGDTVRVSLGLGDADGEMLVAGGHPLGTVYAGAGERWQRLRDAVVPQLATALESAQLVERIRKTHLETIAALSRSMEAKDYYTGGHTERVADVAVALARRLGFRGSDLDAVEIGALLHDIGKIGIPERILHKPAALDEDEWAVMKEHPVISEYILSEVDLSPIVLQIARSSHERMDGGGYPDGLAGEEIPLAARIVLVADAFDALTSDRPYRRGRRVRDALDELRSHVGTQFCPRVMAALEAVYHEEPHVLAGGERLRAVEVA